MTKLISVFLFLLTPIYPLFAAEEVIGTHAEFRAVKPFNYACGSAVHMQIISDKKESLESANKALLKIVGLIRTVVSLDCPQAKRIILTGKHNRGRVFKTRISKDDNWRLNLANNELPSYRKRSPDEKELHIPHSAGKLLLETEEAYIHLSRPTTFSSGRCSNVGGEWVSIVFKSSVVDEVKITEEYMLPFFIDKVIPAVEYECGATPNLSASGQLYLEGIFFNQKGEEVSEHDVIEKVREERFGFFSVQNSFDGKIIAGTTALFNHTVDGAEQGKSPELQTLAGLRAVRSRGWATVSQAKENKKLVEMQNKLLGIEISDGAVWHVVTGEALTSRFYKLDNSYANKKTRVLAQAYGRSTIEVCGDSTPGGTKKIAFVDNFRKKEITITENIGSGSTIVSIPTNLGYSTFNDISGNYAGRGVHVRRVFLKEAKEGLIRQEFDKVIKAKGCLSPVHKKLHSNIKILAERHGLI